MIPESAGDIAAVLKRAKLESFGPAFEAYGLEFLSDLATVRTMREGGRGEIGI